ncbi:DUF4124 domain-containing protein [Massilia sp. LXY-6]|uniref:DUF4124 domain-containing protein n=1 Tax=Massilia sp. LXY-6 TaxID=3379823 RepID=UPI003EE1B30A
MSSPIRWLRPLCACALALTSLLAHAQYSWIDGHGTRVFSDRPPPPGTPPGRILKAPRGLEPAAEPAAASAAPATPATPATPAPDWRVRETAFRERAIKRDQEEREAQAKGRQEHEAECAWARGAQGQLTIARRVEWKNRKGEPELMSDADRARELDKVQRILPGCG